MATRERVRCGDICGGGGCVVILFITLLILVALVRRPDTFSA